MKWPSKSSIDCAFALAGLAGLPPQLDAQSTDHTWTTPRTAWGHPSVEGTWSSDDMCGVPVQRPERFGDRLYLTDQEFAEREGQTAARGRRPESWEDRSLYDAALRNILSAARAEERAIAEARAKGLPEPSSVWRDPGRGQPGHVYSAPRE